MAKSLSPAKATKEINKLASDPLCNLSKSPHAEDRLEERTILTGDLLYLLKNGFIYELAEASTRKDFWKYKIEGVTPTQTGAQSLLLLFRILRQNISKLLPATGKIITEQKAVLAQQT